LEEVKVVGHDTQVNDIRSRQSACCGPPHPHLADEYKKWSKGATQDIS
jgi:hypothetical protein